MNSPITKIEDYRPPTGPIPFTSWTPTFVHSVAEMVARVDAKREFYAKVMRIGEHYGCQPGAAKDAKPALLKAGAELLLSSYGMSAELLDAEPPDRDYDGSTHGGVPLIAYRTRCRVYKQIGVGAEDRILLAQADGFCSSRETKYRYRDGSRKCVTCGKATIIRGKEEWGGGWICHLKKGGCGEKYLTSDQSIASQQVGRIENPDIADQENTILKMSQKRAYVAATLLATGCSDIFTQDEDYIEAEIENVTPRPANNALQPLQKAPPTPQVIQAIAFIEKLWENVPTGKRYALVAKATAGRTEDLHEITVEEGRAIARELLPPKSAPAAAEETPKAESRSEALASTLSAQVEKMQLITPEKNGAHLGATSVNEPKHLGATSVPMVEMIDHEALESLRGNVPMIDMRAIACMAQQCGMGELALRDFVFQITGRRMLTSGTARAFFAAMEQRIADLETV